LESDELMSSGAHCYGGITTILENGDLLIGGAFGIKRVIGS
jgi:hypothetical protein